MDDPSPEPRFFQGLFGMFKKNEGEIEQALGDTLNGRGLERDELLMLKNIIDMRDTLVYEIMVPRTDIVCADAGESFDAIVDLVVQHGHSRLPVYSGDKDNIIGVIHAKDVLKTLAEHLAVVDNHSCDDQSEPASPDLASCIREPYFVPENKNIRELLVEFQSKRIHLAIALDEYGGTSGLVTLEDILEEIVGDIEDEYDAESPAQMQQVRDNAWMVSGQLTLEDFNEATGSALESEQVETVGGYLSERSGRVPRKGEEFSVSGWRFTVRDAGRKKIRWIFVEPNDSATNDGAPYEHAQAALPHAEDAGKDSSATGSSASEAVSKPSSGQRPLRQHPVNGE